METAGYTPFEVEVKDRVVGFFVIGAVLLFLVGFVIPFVRTLAEDEGVPFHTVLDDTHGIAENSQVKLLGVVIGKVTDVVITVDGMVRVDLALSRDYGEFYTKKSYFVLNQDVVDQVFSGSGLILHPASAENGWMDPGARIRTDIPPGLASVLESLDVQQLADQVTEIVGNVETITTDLATNQDKIYRSLDNLETVTASLAEVTESLPGMVGSVDASLQSLRSSLDGMDNMVADANPNLQATLANSVELTGRMTATLAEAEDLIAATTPVMRQLPTVIVTTDVALQSITELTDQLSRSWLLGGNNDAPPRTRQGPGVHPDDDTLYATDTVKPSP